MEVPCCFFNFSRMSPALVVNLCSFPSAWLEREAASGGLGSCSKVVWSEEERLRCCLTSPTGRRVLQNWREQCQQTALDLAS